MTLVHRRELPPIQPFMLSAKQGGIGSHFLTVCGLTGPGIEPWSPGCQADTLPLGHSSGRSGQTWSNIWSTSSRRIHSCSSWAMAKTLVQDYKMHAILKPFCPHPFVRLLSDGKDTGARLLDGRYLETAVPLVSWLGLPQR